MKRAKKRRLSAAGWKVGTVKEFLNLDDEDMAVIELKLDLARAVKTERLGRKLSQQRLSKILGSSQSRLAKMEAGDPSVSIDPLVRTLLKMGTSRERLVRLRDRSNEKRAA